jgi:hypothetical protein
MCNSADLSRLGKEIKFAKVKIDYQQQINIKVNEVLKIADLLCFKSFLDCNSQQSEFMSNIRICILLTHC